MLKLLPFQAIVHLQNKRFCMFTGVSEGEHWPEIGNSVNP